MTATQSPQTQRDIILDNALALMSAHGAAGMSMRDLARSCNLQVAAIYHYFDSKAALLTAVVAERQYGERMQVPLEVDMAAPADERLRGVFRIVWEGALEEESIWRLLLGEGIRGEDAVMPVGRELLELLEIASRDWIAQVVPEVRDPSAAGSLLVGQIMWGFIRRMFRPEATLDPDELSAPLVLALLP